MEENPLLTLLTLITLSPYPPLKPNHPTAPQVIQTLKAPALFHRRDQKQKKLNNAATP